MIKKTLLGIVFCGITLSLCSCLHSSGGGGGGGNAAQGVSENLVYVGDVGGLPTEATCSFEDTRTPVSGGVTMTCQLINQTAAYIFTAEMVNDITGYADVVSQTTSERIRAQVDFFDSLSVFPPRGFVLTLNPFGDAPTFYRFTKR